MSVETDISKAPTETPPAPAQAEAAPSPQTEPVIESGGIKKGRTAEFLGKVNFNPAPKQPNADPGDEARSEASELEAPTEPSEVAKPPAPGEDEVARLKRENEEYQRKFNDLEAARQAAEVQHLSRTQQTELQELTAEYSEAAEAYSTKYYQVQEMLTEYQQAKADQDYETVEAIETALPNIERELKSLYRGQVLAERAYTSKTTEFSTNYDQTRSKAQTQAIEAVAKKYGLTMDELRANAPDLKVTEYFKVLETTAKTLNSKWEAKYKALEKEKAEQADKLRAEFRDQFDNSPGAQPHRLNGGTAGSHVEGIKSGNSGKLLERAFKNL